MRCASHRTVVMAVAKSWKKLTCQLSTPPVKDKPVAGWGMDTTLRLAGGDLGDRAKQPSALSRTLTKALNMTVPSVIAGWVKPIRTTVELINLPSY